ncbi:glutaredoxin family protein [Candidatus Saccharibacteria bacterium]|nr:glutaredoxin family protein [Candidatus Saccharibacteria bacterium]
MEKVKIYTTPTCVYCHALMDWLDSKGVEYQEMDATKEEGISAVPVTEIGGERIVGFDRPAIKKALKKAGVEL